MRVQSRGPSRRALIIGSIGVGSMLALSGCGVRLEQDAPAVPGLRTQDPAPDQDVLLATRRTLTELEQAAGAVAGDGARLATLHRDQLSRLDAVLAGLGVVVPDDCLTPQTTPSAPSSAASPSAPSSAATPPADPGHTTTSPAKIDCPTSYGVLGSRDSRAGDPLSRTGDPLSRTGDPSSRAELARAEGGVGAEVAGVAGARTTHRPLLASILAARGAAAYLLGSAPQWPTARPLPADASADLLAAVRPAVYSVEAVAARTPAAERKPMRALARELATDRSRLEQAAGSVAPPAPLAYPLPRDLTSAGARTQLTIRLLTDIATSAAAQAPTTSNPAQLAGLLALWARATGHAWRLGAPLTPFPGLAG